MRPCASRLFASVVVATFATAIALDAEPVRARPTRPGESVSPAPSSRPASAAGAVQKSAAAKPAPPAATSARGTISLNEAASRLGLQHVAATGNGPVVLKGRGHRAEFKPGSREIEIDGLRLFLGEPMELRGGRWQLAQIDYERRLLPLLRPDLVRPRLVRPRIIALDPGHGGVDRGTRNPKLGLEEKIFALDVAKRLERKLEARGFKVMLTRTGDEKIELSERAAIANRANADLFVSIHFNSLPNDSRTRGAEIFTFAPQHQRSTNSWSPSQRDDTERSAAPVNRYDAWSTAVAHSIHRELIEGLKIFDRGQKIAHFGVLRGLDCPGVLVESGFLSNDEEAGKISTPAYRDQLAGAIADGISSYAATLDGVVKR